MIVVISALVAACASAFFYLALTLKAGRGLKSSVARFRTEVQDPARELKLFLEEISDRATALRKRR